MSGSKWVRNSAVTLFLSLPAALVVAGTWSTDQLLGLNANPMQDFNKTWPYRNLVLQGRAWCPISNLWCETTHGVLLKGPGDPNEGYPAAGESANLVIATRLTSANAGTYAVSFTGKAESIDNYSDASLSKPIYSAATNKTTATLQVVPSNFTSDDPKLVLRFNEVSADFGNLKVMQPGVSIDGGKYTDAALAHYGRAKIIRAMDRLETNGNQDKDWVGSLAADKNSPLGYQHSLRGSMDLANKVGAHPWVNVPHLATDDYMASYMAEIAGTLKPDNFAIVEYSNEPWNYGFSQFYDIANAAWAASEVAIGYSKATTLKVLSISRDDDGMVTVTLSGPHGKAPQDRVYVDVDQSGNIPAAYAILAEGTSGSVLMYETTIRSAATGTVNTTWFNSYVALNPANDLVKPLASFGKPGMYALPAEIKVRYEISRMRAMYTAAVNAGLEDRVRIVKGICLAGFQDEIYGLLWAKEQYGSIAWLDTMGGGLSPAYYLRPRDGREWNMTTPDAVFDELELARGDIAKTMIKLRNILLMVGQSTINGYEAGPHNDLKPSQEIAAAVRTAHRDDPRMATLLADTWGDWVNRGGGPLMYFHAGATASFGGVENGDGSNNNTWSLIEGTLTRYGSKVKDDFYTAQQDVPVVPVGVPGVTTGDILLKDVHQALEVRGAREYLGHVLVDTNANQTRYTYLITADFTRNHTITVDAGTSADPNVDAVSLWVDGMQVDSKYLPSGGVYSGHPPQALSATVNLEAGHHVVEVRLNATRTGAIALHQLHVH